MFVEWVYDNYVYSFNMFFFCLHTELKRLFVAFIPFMFRKYYYISLQWRAHGICEEYNFVNTLIRLLFWFFFWWHGIYLLNYYYPLWGTLIALVNIKLFLWTLFVSTVIFGLRSSLSSSVAFIQFSCSSIGSIVHFTVFFNSTNSHWLIFRFYCFFLPINISILFNVISDVIFTVSSVLQPYCVNNAQMSKLKVWNNCVFECIH